MLGVIITAALAGNMTICVDYDLDFIDSDVSGSDEDYMRTNGLKPARGILVKAQGPTPTIYQAYAETGATDPGCVTLTMPAGVSYTVTVTSIVQATTSHTATVGSGGDTNTGDVFVYTSPSSFLANSSTYNIVLPVGDHWDALAVAGRALTRNQGGRSSLDIDIYVPDSSGDIYPPTGCSSTSSCVDGTDVWIHADHIDRKFRIAHLLGWSILHDMGYERQTLSKNADDSHCNVSDKQLSLGNLEHTTTGYPEGFAYWYAAATFNKSNEEDCSFVFWEDSNWDQLEICHEEMEAAPGHVISCATGPSLPPYEVIVPEKNYRTYCLDERSPGLASSSKPSDTVVPLDVVRFLRERVRTDSGLARNEVGALFASAEPYVGSPFPFLLSLAAECANQGGDGTAWSNASEEHGLYE